MRKNNVRKTNRKRRPKSIKREWKNLRIKQGRKMNENLKKKI